MKKKLFFVLALIFCLPLCLFGCESGQAELSSYAITGEYDEEAQTLSCTQIVSFYNNTGETLSQLCFYVYANAFNEVAVSNAYFGVAYPNGNSFGGLTFSSVTVAEAETEWALEGSVLTVQLSGALFAGEKISVEMEYVLTLANVRHRLGYAEDTVNFGNFFPILCVFEGGEFVKNPYAANGDPFYSEVANFDVKITFSSEFVFASTGEAEIVENDGVKVASCTAENVRDFCFVLSKKFQTISTEAGETTVTYFYYDDTEVEAHLQTAARAVETFCSLFGEYGYATLSVVQADFCFGGMEYPNLVLISDESGEAADYVIVHEIAHQWWYGIVGSNEFEEAWLDEGLTEFSTALFFENNPEYGLEYQTIMDNALATYQNFVKVYTKVLGDVDESMNRSLDEFNTEPEYVNIVYTKGMLLFDCLRQSMSEKKFFKCLQNYFEEFSHKNSSTALLIESFSNSSGRNLQGLFSAWINGQVRLGE